MANSYKLVFTAKDAAGTNRTFSYAHANPEMDAEDVKAAATAIITNGSIFANPPVMMESAKVVATTETMFDLAANS